MGNYNVALLHMRLASAASHGGGTYPGSKHRAEGRGVARGGHGGAPVRLSYGAARRARELGGGCAARRTRRKTEIPGGSGPLPSFLGGLFVVDEGPKPPTPWPSERYRRGSDGSICTMTSEYTTTYDHSLSVHT